MDYQEKIREELLIENYKALSPEMRRALIWWIDNLDTVCRIAERKPFTPVELNLHMQKAVEKHDCILQLFLTEISLLDNP